MTYYSVRHYGSFLTLAEYRRVVQDEHGVKRHIKQSNGKCSLADVCRIEGAIKLGCLLFGEVLQKSFVIIISGWRSVADRV